MGDSGHARGTGWTHRPFDRKEGVRYAALG